MARHKGSGTGHKQTDDKRHRKDLEQHFPLRRCANLVEVRGWIWGAPRRQCGARVTRGECCEADTVTIFARVRSLGASAPRRSSGCEAY